MKDIVMPKLSDTMTEGRLVSWKKSVGDTVKRGEVIAEVETDKANMELEAFASGVLLETRIPAGEMAVVGTVIGVIGAPGEKAQTQGGEKPNQTPAAPEGVPAPEVTNAPFAPEAAGSQQEEPESAPEPEAAGQKIAPTEEKEPPAEPSAAPEGEPGTRQPERHEERAAPVVRRRARELGVDLSSIKGSGPEGRILLEDLEQRAPPPAAPPGEGPPRIEEPAAPVPGPQAAKLTSEDRPLNRFRAAIARTVSESWRSTPQFTVTMEVLMDEAEVLRHNLKDAGLAVTLNDFIVKGAALALAKFPLVNGSFAGDTVKLYSQINIGMVVGLPDALLVPVVRGCQGLTLKEISQQSQALIDRARAGQLSEQELAGGTFTVSNLGMFGVNCFTAIVYPGQAAVLAVGAVAEKVLPKAGTSSVAKVMALTLAADHRILDGVYVAQFLNELKEILEHPARLLV